MKKLSKNNNDNYIMNRELDIYYGEVNEDKTKRFYKTTFYKTNGERFVRFQTAANLWDIIVQNFELTHPAQSGYKSYWTDPVSQETYEGGRKLKKEILV